MKSNFEDIQNKRNRIYIEHRTVYQQRVQNFRRISFLSAVQWPKNQKNAMTPLFGIANFGI